MIRTDFNALGRRLRDESPTRTLRRPHTVLALDPSSKTTGYALMRSPDALIDAGKLTPTRTRDAANDRIAAMLADLPGLIAEHAPDEIIVEDTSGKVGRRHGGGGAGLAVHGKAVGAVWRACEQLLPGKVRLVLENTWTRGTSKASRQARVARLYASYDAAADAGGDVADAIGLARWWLETRMTTKETR